MSVLCPDGQTLTARVGCRIDPWMKWPGFGPESGCLVVPMAMKCRAMGRWRPVLLQHHWDRVVKCMVVKLNAQEHININHYIIVYPNLIANINN